MGDIKSVYSGLLKRFLSAVVLIPPVIAVIWFGDVWFLGLLAFGGILMILEWLKLTKVAGSEYQVIAIVALLFVLLHTSQKPSWSYFTFFMGLSVGLVVLSYLYSLFKMRHMAWMSLGLFYVLTPLLALLWIRNQTPSDEEGRMIVFWIFLLVWGTDIGGYFVGKTLGGPKLAPRISPNKTWSGLVGGMILAGLVCQLTPGIFGLSRLELFFASAGLAVFAQMGDIAESSIKRRFNVKNSGELIPGHGGILDRVDGLGPVAAIVAMLLSLVI